MNDSLYCLILLSINSLFIMVNHFSLFRVSLVMLLFALSSCNFNKKDVPFDYNSTQFVTPIAKPFKFSKPQKYQLMDEKISAKDIKVTKLDIDKLPSSPLDMDGWQPLLKPLKETKIDWVNLKTNTFDIDKLPKEKLIFKTSILGIPTVVKTGKPEVKNNGFNNILVFKEGLPNKNISDILKDSKGAIWIATSDGLCHFTGESCNIYNKEQGFESTSFNKLCEDNQGQIWAGMRDGGLCVINSKAGIIKSLSTKNGLGENSVWGLLNDKLGNVWVGTWGGGIDIVNEKEGVIKHLKDEINVNKNNIRSFLLSSNGEVWAGSGSGVDIINVKNKTTKNLSTEQGLSDNDIELIFESNEDEIWLGTRNEVNILNKKTGTIKHLSTENGLSNNNIRSFYKDKYERMWIGNSKVGIDILDTKNNRIKLIGINEGLSAGYISKILNTSDNQIWLCTPDGINIINESYNVNHFRPATDLKDNKFWDILETSNSQIWLGSDDGVYIIDKFKKVKKLFKLTSPVVKILEDSKGKIWLGTEGKGVFIYNPFERTLRNIEFTHIGKQGNNVFSITEDDRNQIWIGHAAGGLSIIHKDYYSIKSVNTPIDFGNVPVSHLLNEKDGKIWASTFRAGIFVFDQKEATFQILDKVHGLNSNQIINLHKSKNSDIWAGSLDGGIDIIDIKKSTITNLSTKEGLSSDFILNIIESKKGTMYALTETGLSSITQSKDSTSNNKKWLFKTYGDNKGFGNFEPNFLGSVQLKNGDFWWNLNNRIVIMKPTVEDTFISKPKISSIDIINHRQYFINNNFRSSLLEKIDSIYDNQSNKFINTKSIEFKSDYLKKYNIEFDSVSGEHNLPANLRLPHNQNHLTFHFISEGSKHFDKAYYSYFLQGFDEKWSKVSDKSYTENYINLEPGDYNLKVSSKGFNGKWSTPTEFKFKILPPWWQTWWAYLGLFLGLLGTAFGIAQMRAASLQKENKLLEEKVKLRTDELEKKSNDLEKSIIDLKATQSQLLQSEKMASLGELTAGIAHEIQNPLNFVNNFSEVSNELLDEMKTELDKGDMEEAKNIADDIKQNLEKINHHGKRADAIVKGMLQHSRKSTGVKEPTDINALADEYLRLSYHGLRAKDKSFNATMITDFDSSIGKINIVQQDIGRVILNIITNAFYACTERLALSKTEVSRSAALSQLKFDPTIWVSTKKENDKVIISIKDNGNGIPQDVIDKIFQPFFTTKPTGQGTGLGLSMSYDIVKAHGGELKVDTKEGEGTEFTIQLPL